MIPDRKVLAGAFWFLLFLSPLAYLVAEGAAITATVQVDGGGEGTTHAVKSGDSVTYKANAKCATAGGGTVDIDNVAGAANEYKWNDGVNTGTGTRIKATTASDVGTLKLKLTQINHHYEIDNRPYDATGGPFDAPDVTVVGVGACSLTEDTVELNRNVTGLFAYRPAGGTYAFDVDVSVSSGSAQTGNNQITFDAPGSVTFTGKVGTDTSQPKTVKVVGVKSVSVNNATILAGATVQATATPDPEDASWPSGKPAWTAPGGSVSGSGSSVDISYATPGNQTITASCGNSKDTKVTVKGIASISGDELGVAGGMVKLTALPSPSDQPFPNDQPEWSCSDESVSFNPKKGESTMVTLPAKTGKIAVKAKYGNQVTHDIQVVSVNLTAYPEEPADLEKVTLNINVEPKNACVVKSAKWTSFKPETDKPKNVFGRITTLKDIQQAGSPTHYEINPMIWYGYGDSNPKQPSATLDFNEKRFKPSYTLTGEVFVHYQGKDFVIPLPSKNFKVRLGGYSGFTLIGYTLNEPSIDQHKILATKVGEIGKNDLFDVIVNLPDRTWITKTANPRGTSNNQYKSLIISEEQMHARQWRENTVSIEEGGASDVCRNEDVLTWLTLKYGAKKLSPHQVKFEKISILKSNSWHQQKKEIDEFVNAQWRSSLVQEARFGKSFFVNKPEDGTASQRAKVSEWVVKKKLFQEAFLYYFAYSLEAGWEVDPANENSESKRIKQISQ